MKPAWNRGKDSDVVLLMEREESGNEWDDVPVTQRCVYVQDRDSQKWIARAQAKPEHERVAADT
jgi:hypothetical protein